MASKSTYTDRFGPFRGVDFSSDPKDVAPYRFSYSENMWRNYNRDGGSAIETIPGFRLVKHFEGKINGIHSFRAMEKGDTIDYILVHAGTEIYYTKLDERDGGPYKVLGTIGDHRSRSVQHNNRLYLLDGEHMWVIKDVEEDGVRGLVLEAMTESAYLPTTHINGQAFEQRNMVCNKVKETFSFPSTQEDYEAWIGEGLSDSYDLYFNNPADQAKVQENFKIFANGQPVLMSDEEDPLEGGEALATMSLHMSPYGDVKKAVFPFDENPDDTAEDVRFSIRRSGDTYDISLSIREGAAGSAESFISIASIDYKNNAGKTIKLPALPNGSSRIYRDYFCGLRYELYQVASNGAQTPIEGFQQSHETEEPMVFDGVQNEDYPTVLSHGAEVNYTIPKDLYDVSGYVVHLTMKVIVPGGYSSNEYRYKWKFNPPINLRYDWLKENESQNILGVIVKAQELNASLAGIELEYTYPVDPMKFGTASTEGDFAQGNPSYNGTTVDAINQCTICAAYDGRIFLTGNPALPNTVFYCQRDNTGAVNASYWGTYNYFNEGVERSGNAALLPTADALLVFKGMTTQDGAVYARQGVNQDDDLMPRIYVGSSGVAGIGCLGTAVNFYDDPVFLSSRGLDSIRKQAINLERSVRHRSSNVDTKMLQEDLSNARMVEWRGYLLLFFPSGHVYMADSRALFNHQHGSVEYEWFFLSGIGEYPNAARKYVYADYNYAGDGYEIADKERWNQPTFVPPSWASSSKGTFPYVEAGGKNLLVASDGSFRTDKLTQDGYEPDAFSGASEALSIGDVLLFGTPAGGLFCFNNDLEGEALFGAADLAGSTAPKYLYAAGRMLKDNKLSIDGGNGVVFEQIREGIPGILHRQHYHFDGQPIVSGCITSASDAGIPYMTKTTVPRTAVCVYKAMPGARFSVLVSLDDGQFEEEQVVDMSNLDLDDFDFGSVAFTGSSSSSIAIRTHEKRWVHKKHQFYSNEYLRPFGIYSMSYAATVAGRIKNR